MDFTRTHEASPLDDSEIDSFPDVLLMMTILGNPRACIDEEGNLQLPPDPLINTQRAPLPDRKTL